MPFSRGRAGQHVASGLGHLAPGQIEWIKGRLKENELELEHDVWCSPR